MTAHQPVTAQPALMVVDLARMGPARSVRDLLGRAVLNDEGQEVGVVEDLLTDGVRLTYALLSVGGFLGLGLHRVVVDFADLAVDGLTVVLPGATRETLCGLTALGPADGARLFPPRGRVGVRDTGHIVTTAIGEPIAGVIADVADGDR